MLDAIIRFSLRFRGIVYALAVLAAGYGLFSLSHAKLDVFPEFAPPMSIVQVEAPGLTSEQVETLVTQPMENGLGGMVGLQSMRSRSMQGLASITLVFDAHANVMQIRQLVSERVNALAATYYPTSLRATGVGWSLGIGRIGSIVGPVIGGELIRLNWSNATLFIAAAVPALISASMLALIASGRRTLTEVAPKIPEEA